MDQILGFSAQVLERVGGSTDKGAANLPEESVRLVVQLLTTPQQVLGLEGLDLEHYSHLLEQLSFVPRKKVFFFYKSTSFHRYLLLRDFIMLHLFVF